MRKVIVSEFITLDGVVERPEKWNGDAWNDEIEKFKSDELFASDALLLGRVTYEIFAGSWPERSNDDPFTNRMNSLPKFVASKTLKKVEWNNATLIKGNVAEEVAQLKQQPGKDILVGGSGALVQMLMQHNLVDEYRLLVYPLVLGSGKRFFVDGNKMTLKLIDTKPFSTGVVALTYTPA